MKRDVIIIGAGIVGCAIARELSKYNLTITVIEKGDDVSSGISKANSGIIHAGYNETKGTLKSKLNVEGNKLYDELSKDLDFTFIRNGALVLAFNDEDKAKLEQLKENGLSLGIEGLEIINKEDLKELEPNISDNAIAALHAKTSGIINPYEASIALAENANVNGCEFLFNSEVINIDKTDDEFIVKLQDGTTLFSKIVINAAGINSAVIANKVNNKKYNMELVKGEYLLLDKTCGNLVASTIFTVPTKETKGILITKTADGNLLVGPTALKVDESSYESTNDGLNELIEKSKKSVPGIPFNKVLNSFAGLRPNLDTKDFIIENDNNFINLVGICSPGLTAAPAIAVYVKTIISKVLTLNKKDNFNPYRKGIIKFTSLTTEEKNKLIANNPAYGKMICKCELITEGEIIDSIHRPLGARTLDAVKRRTRATMGGCQGTGCMLPVCKIIARELNIPITEVTKNNSSSVIAFNKED